MNIPLILKYLRPGEEWSLNGDLYDGLEWISSTDKPTLQELEAAWPAVQQAAAIASAAQNEAAATAIEHAKSLGFTDEMIAAMYPNLVVP